MQQHVASFFVSQHILGFITPLPPRKNGKAGGCPAKQERWKKLSSLLLRSS